VLCFVLDTIRNQKRILEMDVDMSNRGEGLYRRVSKFHMYICSSRSLHLRYRYECKFVNLVLFFKLGIISLLNG